MLERKNRITQKKDFDRIFKKGKGFKDGFFLLKVASPVFGVSRFAFVVSQKVAKKATARNKIKRRLRSILKKHLGDLTKKVDGVFVVLPGLGKSSFSETQKSVDNLLKKAKLI